MIDIFTGKLLLLNFLIPNNGIEKKRKRKNAGPLKGEQAVWQEAKDLEEAPSEFIPF